MRYGFEESLMKNIIRFDEHGDTVSFYKEGWNSIAQIDNIPEIVTVVKENMWSDNNGYLYCAKLKKYLHRLVVEFKVGAERLQELTNNGFVVDHLNNDEKYNCCLDNLHIISSDLNIAKGHTVDKDIDALWQKAGIGIYLLKNNEYQIAVGFNVSATVRLGNCEKIISDLYWNFDNFDKCYLAIQTIISALKGQCNLYADRLQATKWWYREAIIMPPEYAKLEGPLIKIGDNYVLKINNKPGPKMAIIDKPAKIE